MLALLSLRCSSGATLADSLIPRHSHPSNRPILPLPCTHTARLNKLLVKALGNLEEYTANAGRLAGRIYAEDGAGRAADLIEAEIS